jgi:CO/xanthine dehydrogenase Mo-binding subunit
MGPESGLAIPAEDGGVELYMSTQWLHVDRDQVAACLGAAGRQGADDAGRGRRGVRRPRGRQPADPRLPAGLRTNRPVKMLYNREESFFGHVHRHPAAVVPPPRRPRRHLVKVEARVVLDGGAYASTSSAVIANAVCFARALPGAQRLDRRLRGADQQPAVRCDARVRGRAGLLRPTSRRWTSSPRARHGSGRAAPEERPGDRRHAHHRPGHHRRPRRSAR